MGFFSVVHDELSFISSHFRTAYNNGTSGGASSGGTSAAAAAAGGGAGPPSSSASNAADGTGASGGTSSSVAAVNSAVAAATRSLTSRRRLYRASSSRSRGASGSTGVIMSRNTHIIPAQYVPEDMIAQAHNILQGKSRNVIIRELQRTNLDVNMAVNNLLSRDDEEFDEGEGDEQMLQSPDDLVSLLESGLASNDHSVIIDSEFSEEVFGYPLRLRGSNSFHNAPASSLSSDHHASAARGSRATGAPSSSSSSFRPRDESFSFLDREFQLVHHGGVSAQAASSGTAENGATSSPKNRILCSLNGIRNIEISENPSSGASSNSKTKKSSKTSGTVSSEQVSVFCFLMFSVYNKSFNLLRRLPSNRRLFSLKLKNCGPGVRTKSLSPSQLYTRSLSPSLPMVNFANGSGARRSHSKLCRPRGKHTTIPKSLRWGCSRRRCAFCPLPPFVPQWPQNRASLPRG